MTLIVVRFDNNKQDTKIGKSNETGRTIIMRGRMKLLKRIWQKSHLLVYVIHQYSLKYIIGTAHVRT